MATIDVLMPVRNGMPFLAEAIDSIRKQTFSDWRLLVLDHGSSDGSLELDVVPLFESRADLEAAAGVLDALLELPGWRAWLEGRAGRLSEE